MKAMNEQLYRKLLPVERAQMAFEAAARCDREESDRLLGTIPLGAVEDHRRAWMSLTQAADIFAHLYGRAEVGLRTAEAAFLAEMSYCEGWLDAGGDLGAPQMIEREREAKRIRPVMERFRAQAAGFAVGFEGWCEEQGVSPETILTPTGRTLGDTESPCPEAVAAIRSVLDVITLTG